MSLMLSGLIFRNFKPSRFCNTVFDLVLDMFSGPMTVLTPLIWPMCLTNVDRLLYNCLCAVVTDFKWDNFVITQGYFDLWLLVRSFGFVHFIFIIIISKDFVEKLNLEFKKNFSSVYYQLLSSSQTAYEFVSEDYIMPDEEFTSPYWSITFLKYVCGIKVTMLLS